MARRVGFTSTIPVEIILAAGDIPIDLNNLFINDPESLRYVRLAEEAGYPRNICGWIKGLYGVVVDTGCVDVVIALTQGDCSSTLALVETLMVHGVSVIPFEYPFSRDRDLLRLQIAKLAKALGQDIHAGQEWLERLRPLRMKLAEIDRLTWQEGTVSGSENHALLVSASDFCGDVIAFQNRIDDFLKEISKRKALPGDIRLGYIGVPPVWSGLHDYLELQGARIVFNETQRQFSMSSAERDIVEQYLRYTYPYGVFARLEDITAAVSERAIDGIIHYTQSFCFRQIEDMIFRKKLQIPILTIEGDQPAPLDDRTRLRINAFIEMLRKRAGDVARRGDSRQEWASADKGKDS
jgi:benzoyl-CoA reductase/2-hydroxyglutaryl-CoA dehydratase subunit BcrC/BadD/HgdB